MFENLVKSKLLIAAFIVFGFFAGAISAQARDRDDRKCEQRIHRAEENLEKAERKHGPHSRQAEQKRHELEEARERCHHDRDRDRDHDRDRDRDRH